jgi:hypothetical protein
MALRSRNFLKPPPVISRALFDRIIDCLYEYDLGDELPQRWPKDVRRAIETARKRILKRVSLRRQMRVTKARRYC